MKVTAAIFRDGDKVLLMRRAANQPLAGEWEYPGGKFEDGEDGPTCLRRELYEELGIDAEIGDLITIAKHTADSGKVIELHAYEITSCVGEIQLRVHDDMHWVPVSDLPSHPQLPADLIVSKMLIKILISSKPFVILPFNTRGQG
jgi:mutator protein MutT